MGIKKFGRLLLETNDLDPIYVMLHNSGMPLDQKKRWLLAYSCYYNAGVASFCSEGQDRFYKRLRNGHIKKWPRGSERRHFRGHTSDHVTTWLPSEYPLPEDAVNFLIGSKGNRTFKDVTSRVKQWKFFGPWIAFKWADLIDRVLHIDVDFSGCELDFYDSPKKGAELYAAMQGNGWTPNEVIDHLIEHFSKYEAPPFYDRPIGVQEVETILCKWHSHTKGHYHIGKDIHEIGDGLVGWGDCSESLIKHLPKKP